MASPAASSAGQLAQQRLHARSQVDEDPDEAARLRQLDRLLQRDQGRLRLPLGSQRQRAHQ